MEKFEFIVVQKVSLWTRAKIHVEGENKKDTKEKLLKELSKNNEAIYNYMNDESEYLYDTEDILTPKQNGNRATIEIFEDNAFLLKNRIYCNEK